jgi:hypothetical protein
MSHMTPPVVLCESHTEKNSVSDPGEQSFLPEPICGEAPRFWGTMPSIDYLR